MGKSLMSVQGLLNRLKLSIMGLPIHISVSQDKAYKNGRPYLQIGYHAPCTKTGKMGWWKGRKWYLSEFMTNDEIIKTAFAAFKAAIEHEVMEGFKMDGKVVFNPHVSFEALLSVTHQEVKRLDSLKEGGSDED